MMRARIYQTILMVLVSALVLSAPRPVLAIVYALESTQLQNNMVLGEIRELTRNLNAHLPSIPTRINQYAGQMAYARTYSDHALTVSYGVARAQHQAITEFGNMSVIQDVCSGSGRIPESMRSSTDTAYRDVDAFVQDVMAIGRMYSNMQQQQRYLFELSNFVGDPSDLHIARNNLELPEWDRLVALEKLIITQDDPPVLKPAQKNTIQGVLYEPHRKIYEAYKLYVSKALDSVTADTKPTIDFQQWKSGQGGDALLYDLPPPYEEVVKDKKTGKEMLSRKSALKLLVRARLENPKWWENVGHMKSATWMLREQTMLAGIQADIMMRILERLDDLVRLNVIQATDAMHNVSERAYDTYKEAVKHSVGSQ